MAATAARTRNKARARFWRKRLRDVRTITSGGIVNIRLQKACTHGNAVNVALRSEWRVFASKTRAVGC